MSANKRRNSGESLSPPPLKKKLPSVTTNKAVQNFFRPASQKEPEKMAWRVVNESLLIGRFLPTHALEAAAKSQGKRKIAAFDFDSTLVTPASGNRFGKDSTDWKWWHASVPGILKDLHREGYLVAVVSNQGGISLRNDSKSLKSDLKRLSDFKGKFTSVAVQLDFPISIYAATSKDQYRKPRVGMWAELRKDNHLGSLDSVDLENSFFVGDAGGRPRDQAANTVKDHSCVDRDFAANVGVQFKTPEEYFLKEEAKAFIRDFDPSKYIKDDDTKGDGALPVFSKASAKDLVLLCGSPGAGKSTFYWRHLKPLGYERVNQDILKSRDKCIKVASSYLADGVSVAVDNTNADPETRAHWVRLARESRVPIRCVLFTADARLCEHNDAVRALNGGSLALNPESRALLPKMAFTGFSTRYRSPELTEGFQDIITIDFKFTGDPDELAVWRKYWT